MWLIALGLILSVAFGVSAHEEVQPAISQPARLAGPWEVAGPSKVDGIVVMIEGSQKQTIQVRVYHRDAGRGTAGWYSVTPMPNTSGASFDGTNLHVLGLSATFEPIAARWTGEWVLDGETRNVVLERPHPAKGSSPNLLCGDWQNVAAPQPQGAPTTSVFMHILQSQDGTLTAWIDTESVIIPQRYESKTFGRPMKVESADPGNVVLQVESAVYQKARDHFTGVISADGNSLTGTWNGRAAETFRRIR